MNPRTWIFIYWTVVLLLMPFYIRLVKYILENDKQKELDKLNNDRIIILNKRIQYLNNCIVIINSVLTKGGIQIELPKESNDRIN